MNDNYIDLTNTFDASIHAREFLKVIEGCPELAVDKHLLTGWFANAMMAGYEYARRNI